MKAYGVKKKDNDCCPGHNKISSDTYNRSKKAKRRDTKYAHGRERSKSKIETKKNGE